MFKSKNLYGKMGQKTIHFVKDKIFQYQIAQQTQRYVSAPYAQLLA